MSDVAAARSRSSSMQWSLAAVVLAVASVGSYVLSGAVDDGLYLLTGLLGVAAFAVGLKARRKARRAAAPTWPAVAAAVVGGLLGGLVIAFAIAFAVSELV